MKNKNWIFALYSFLSFVVVAGVCWFLAVWIPDIKISEHIIEIIIYVCVILLMFTLTVIFAYKVKSNNTDFAVRKGLNSVIALIMLIAGLCLALLSVYNVANYYKGRDMAPAHYFTNLSFGILVGVAGIVLLLISLFMFHKNAKIKDTEERLNEYNAEPKKVETFEDKKVIKTCKFCGCRLKESDVSCPNCGSKIE